MCFRVHHLLIFDRFWNVFSPPASSPIQVLSLRVRWAKVLQISVNLELCEERHWKLNALGIFLLEKARQLSDFGWKFDNGDSRPGSILLLSSNVPLQQILFWDIKELEKRNVFSKIHTHFIAFDLVMQCSFHYVKPNSRHSHIK